MNEAKKVTVNGEKYTFKELSNMTGINILTIKTRYKKGIRGSGLIKPLERTNPNALRLEKSITYIRSGAANGFTASHANITKIICIGYLPQNNFGELYPERLNFTAFRGISENGKWKVENGK